MYASANAGGLKSWSQAGPGGHSRRRNFAGRWNMTKFATRATRNRDRTPTKKHPYEKKKEKMDSAQKSLMEQRRLLTLEYQEERESFRRLTDRTGVGRLVGRGAAWWPIRVGRSYFNSLNQRVVEVWRSEGDSEADHHFDHARPVTFFVMEGAGADIPRHVLQGMVSYVDNTRMVISVADGADLAQLAAARSAGVMLSFDETSYRAMFDALDRTMKAKGRHGELRDLFHMRHPQAGTLVFPPMGVPYLNKAQERAVDLVLRAKDVAVVHGPPGTGKTTTLVEAIHETLRRESQVLVCAQSNMAVDWISEQLVDRGINVLRIGNPSRVNDKMLSFTYERRFEDHPDYPTLWSLRKAMRELHGHRRSTDQWHQKMDRLKARSTELELRINAEIMGQARVVASTLVGSGSRLLEGMRFSTLFIDEAAQALEAACWIPIRRAGRVIFAGDHCQLPATVKSLEAQRGGLGKSLMERIVENHPEAVAMLSMQYRMHEDIMRFPNEWFYKGEMEAAPQVRHRGILDLDTPIEWIDTGALSGTQAEDACDAGYREEEWGDGHGRVNRAEAELALSTLADYLERIGRERVLEERLDTGLISPYRAQTQYLRQRLRQSARLKPYRHLITIDTVDGFQGRERDIIVISMVRSNETGQIGFLSDLRRMNVAITRARMKLIVIGDRATLSRHRFYRLLAAHADLLRPATGEDLSPEVAPGQ